MNAIKGILPINFLENLKGIVTLIIIIVMSSLIILTSLTSSFSSAVNGIKEWLFPTPVTTTEIKNIVITGLKDMNELTSVNMSSKTTIKSSQEKKISRFTIGDTNVIYEAVGQVQAGIDISKLTATWADPEKHRIHIQLPPPYISNVFLDVSSSHVIDSYKNWLGPDTERQLLEESEKQALEYIKAEACAGDILQKANNNAKNLVEGILRAAEYENITIDVQSPSKDTCKKG